MNIIQTLVATMNAMPPIMLIVPSTLSASYTHLDVYKRQSFASILIYAMDLLPNRIGLIGGLFYGLNFGLGGIAAAILGVMAESHGVHTVFRYCSFLPLAGLLAWFLPLIDEGPGT